MNSPDDLAPLHPQGSGGYADLLLAYAAGGPAALAAAAALLGYQPGERRPAPPPPDLPRQPSQPQPPPDESAAPPEFVASPAADIPYWRPVKWTAVQPVAVERPEIPTPQWAERPQPPDLSRWAAVLPRARSSFTEWADGKAPDVAAMVRRLEAGGMLDRLPRRQRRRWGHGVQIIIDRGTRLVPFYEDQDRIALRLARLFPRHAVQYALAQDGFAEPFLADRRGRLTTYRRPDPGTLVVVLGDLGCLAGSPQRAVANWAALGLRLAAAGCRPVALTPCPRARWLPLQAWTMLEWDRRGASPTDPRELHDRAERLLRLLSPAIRIEPGLLREVRLLLGAAADAGTEADVWQHRDLIGRSSVAGTLDPKAAKRLREERLGEVESLRQEVVTKIRRYRTGLAEELWIEELLCLDEASLPADIRAIDLPWARRTLADMVPEVARDRGGLAWNRRLHERVSGGYHHHDDPALQAAQEELRRLAYPEPSERPAAGLGFDPAQRPGTMADERVVALRQVGDAVVAADPGAVAAGVPLVSLRTANGWLRVAEEDLAEDDGRDPFWKSGIPPSWAEDWGWDAFGAWVTFTVGAVTQKMRWCPPGRFLMGSPEDEDGRYDDEGPQHEVTISRGFWLFDTPCTQALWRAVMGENPSKFPGAERPVEQVRWTDVQDFLAKLNERCPGLEPGLPSEAQWEYACRAGTTTALYTGDIDIEDDKADALDPIARYHANSGGQTHPVKGKPANPWGLHDMLGNVWEWCADTWHHSYDGAPADGSAWTAPGEQNVERVVRGGSWSSVARIVRAAFRFRFRPYVRNVNLGFRCARVPVSPASQAAAEPADPVKGRQAERRSEQGPSGAAAMLRLVPGGEDRCPMPRSPAFRIDSDCERLSFSRLTQSDLPWAKSIGRDRSGLWAAFSVGEVTQKMRWIPPGQFLMGSPPDEPKPRDRARHGEREVPRHQVTIGRGFWLFDTPCTQALWSAVMKDNPSRFKSPTRPVEQVDWAMVQDFLSRINDRVPGLDLSLPSEARWEYACRAGTTTALYTGDIDILGTNNAPALDPIAWYGGNSGVEFDLDDGHDSKKWPEKPYPHEKAGTRPVGLKRANPWGLYDMLGNVWEWCADDWHGRYDGAPADGTAWTAPDKPGVGRVVRGGSWGSTARNLRAAFRAGYLHGVRLDALGFRCARVQP